MKNLFIILLCLLANTALFGQYIIKVSTSYNNIYYYNQPITISLSAVNFSIEPHTMTWTSSCEANYKIIGKYNWLDDHVCRDTTINLNFAPEGGNTWSFFYNSQPLPPGYYKIAGEVIGYGSDTIQIKVIDTLSTKYAAYYSASVKDSATGLPDIVMVAAEGADSIYTNPKGRFLLEFYSSAFADSQTIHPVVKIITPYDEYYSRRITISKGDSITGPEIRLVQRRVPIVSGRVNFGNQGSNRVISLFFLGKDNSNGARITADSNGIFSIPLSSGSYYVLCGMTYYMEGYKKTMQEYYNNTFNLNDASLLNITNDTSNIDFTFSSLQMGTISGTVRDAITHQSINQTQVKVFTDTANAHYVLSDQDGNYSIQVPEGNYYVVAYKTYLYYRMAYNDSTPVKVDSNNLNVTGIDFNLIDEQIAKNYLVGYVKDLRTGKPLANVEVYAIPDSGGLLAETKSDVNGRYYMGEIVDGKYFLLYNKDGYNSMYYNSAYEWEASVVNEFNGNEHLTLNDVYLTPTDTLGGDISGKISTASDSALNHALIFAINSFDSVVSTAISNSSGSYTILHLSNDEYTVKANEVGYSTEQYPTKVKIDLNSQPDVNGVDFVVNVTGIKNYGNAIPTSYKLLQNYPNPFNPTTTISYQLPKSGFVTLKIYDVLGKLVKTLVDREKPEGSYSVQFDGSSLASGIYFYQLIVRSVSGNNFTSTKKLVLLK